jgi:hypothetical protein
VDSQQRRLSLTLCEALHQFPVGQAVIKVGVGVDDVFYLEAQLTDLRQDLISITAGINDGSLFGLFTADYVTVGHDGADLQHLDDQFTPPFSLGMLLLM